LAVGIATSIAMFAVLHAVLLRPLPVRNQDRLVYVTKHLKDDQQDLPFWLQDLVAFRALSTVVDEVGGAQYDGPYPQPVRIGRDAFEMNSSAVTSNFFSVLGVPAEIGSLTVASDASPLGSVAISYRVWASRFGRSPTVVGSTIQLRTGPATIIGVTPPRFDFPHGTDGWNVIQPPPGKEEAYSWFSGVIRLKPGVSFEHARAAMQLALTRRDATHPAGSPKNEVIVVRSLLDATIGNLRSSTIILSVAVGLVFLVAIGNAASLLLIQGSARGRELAIRTALGGSRSRIVRLLTIESGLLAVGGALLGIGLGYGLLRLVARLTPAELARVGDVEISVPVLLIAVICAAAATLLSGTLPALLITRSSPFSVLRSGQVGNNAVETTVRFRHVLVTLQVALGVLVATGAGLLIRTLENLTHLNLGVDRPNLTIVHVVPRTDTRTFATLAFYRELTARVGTAPGIQSATPLTSWPFTGWRGWTVGFSLPGQDQRSGPNRYVDWESVAPNYFDTMGIPLLNGRLFSEDDRLGQPFRVIVNETLARSTWPGRNPVGQTLIMGIPFTVVGVVADTRFRHLPTPAPAVYGPLAQTDSTSFVVPEYVAVRSRLTRDQVTMVVRRAVAEVAPDATIYQSTSMQEAVNGPLARPRFNAALLFTLAAVALLLVGTGLFATISAIVQQRTREIGVRMALGAERAQIGRSILRTGLLLTAVGLVLGLGVSVIAARLLEGLLFGVKPVDLLTLVVTALVLTVITILACLAPTIRAARIDPMASLRLE
jgi:predicted permease